MNRRVILRDDARQDIDSISDYIAQDSIESGAPLPQGSSRADSRGLAEMPGKGGLREFDSPHLHGIRSWPIKGFPNHLIFYCPCPGGIELLRVLHGARDVDRISGG